MDMSLQDTDMSKIKGWGDAIIQAAAQGFKKNLLSEWTGKWTQLYLHILFFAFSFQVHVRASGLLVVPQHFVEPTVQGLSTSTTYWKDRIN